MKESTKMGFTVGLIFFALSLPQTLGFVALTYSRPIVDTTPHFLRERPENPYVRERSNYQDRCTQRVYDRHLECVANGINDSQDLSDLIDGVLQSSIEHTCARIHNREMIACLSSEEARYWDRQVRDFEDDLERYGK